MAVEEYPIPQSEDVRLQLAYRLLFAGKTNNILEVTLNASATTTTVTDPRIGPYTVPLCEPTTANAAAISRPYRSNYGSAKGSMILTHANDANNDKSFRVVLVG